MHNMSFQLDRHLQIIVFFFESVLMQMVETELELYNFHDMQTINLQLVDLLQQINDTISYTPIITQLEKLRLMWIEQKHLMKPLTLNILYELDNYVSELMLHQKALHDLEYNEVYRNIS